MLKGCKLGKREHTGEEMGKITSDLGRVGGSGGARGRSPHSVLAVPSWGNSDGKGSVKLRVSPLILK